MKTFLVILETDLNNCKHKLYYYINKTNHEINFKTKQIPEYVKMLTGVQK